MIKISGYRQCWRNKTIVVFVFTCVFVDVTASESLTLLPYPTLPVYPLVMYSDVNSHYMHVAYPEPDCRSTHFYLHDPPNRPFFVEDGLRGRGGGANEGAFTFAFSNGLVVLIYF